MRCTECPMYKMDVDPDGVTRRLCQWDGHQVVPQRECDAHLIKLNAFMNLKEQMRKECRDGSDRSQEGNGEIR